MISLNIFYIRASLLLASFVAARTVKPVGNVDVIVGGVAFFSILGAIGSLFAFMLG